MPSKKRELSPSTASPAKSDKKKYKCSFQAAWEKEFPHIRKSEKGDAYAKCTLCNSSFGVYAGGRNDVSRHVTGPQHTANFKTASSTRGISSFCKPTSTVPDKVTKAAVLFSTFVAEHNLPFAVADHFTDLCKQMFPDSQIAKEFACRRTKTTHVINRALAPCFDDKISTACREEKFSVMIDESNDQGGEKSMAILIRVADRQIRQISTRFLAMPTVNIGTGENLFNALNEVFIAREIPWRNVIGYGSDNASVMIGKNNSVLSRIREVQPSVFDLGCICHLANTCIQYGLKKLSLPVEELLIDVYYHFFHSAKRKEEYKEFQAFTETEPMKLLKHCSTRWLSLEKCVRRLLQQWPALKSYFVSHDEVEKAGRVQRCANLLQDPEMELVYRFIEYIMGPLNEFNTTFQADASMVGYLHTEMVRLLRKFLGKFVKTSVITASRDITQVDYANPDNQHPDNNLAVGMAARSYLSDNPDTPPETVQSFFGHVRDFYEEVTAKMVQKFPFKDETLKTLGFVNPALKEAVPVESVVALAQRFDTNANPEILMEECLDYQLAPASELPAFDSETTRLDSFWFAMGEVTLPTGKLRFKNLSSVAVAALSLPHSNADPERCFSILRKIQTDQRGNLCEKTINSLLTLKFNMDSECYKYSPGTEVLRKAKTACSN